jgi:hypothetical protein
MDESAPLHVRLVPRPHMFLLMLPPFFILASLLCSTSQPDVPLNPIPAIIAPLLQALALGMLWWGTRERSPSWLMRAWNWAPDWCHAPLLRAALVTPLIVLGLNIGIRSTVYYIHPTQYLNDALVYIHMDAELLLRGQNPYTSQNAIWEAALRWPTGGATPMMYGYFGSCASCYPSDKKLEQRLQQEAQHPELRGPEFNPATAHNYPAGSFLAILPVVWAGGAFILWPNYLATIGIILLVWLHTPRKQWAALALALICACIISFSTNFDALCLVFVLLAWHTRDRPRLSPLLFGWACATKQVAWFFIPFYLIESWRRYGPRATCYRAGWMVLAMALPNLPFLIANPYAFLSSLLIPMSAPMFPVGMGIVAPAIAGVWPVWPSLVYGMLEMCAWIGLAIYQARRREITSDGLLLAMMPLFLARRDPVNYVSVLPLFALWLWADKQRLSAPMDDACQGALAVQPAINGTAKDLTTIC